MSASTWVCLCEEDREKSLSLVDWRNTEGKVLTRLCVYGFHRPDTNEDQHTHTHTHTHTSYWRVCTVCVCGSYVVNHTNQLWPVSRHARHEQSVLHCVCVCVVCVCVCVCAVCVCICVQLSHDVLHTAVTNHSYVSPTPWLLYVFCLCVCASCARL